LAATAATSSSLPRRRTARASALLLLLVLLVLLLLFILVLLLLVVVVLVLLSSLSYCVFPGLSRGGAWRGDDLEKELYGSAATEEAPHLAKLAKTARSSAHCGQP